MNSIEWLMEQLTINGSGAVKTFPELFEQAKLLHNQETIEAWEMGRFNIDAIGSGEEYYNETYKK